MNQDLFIIALEAFIDLAYFALYIGDAIICPEDETSPINIPEENLNKLKDVLDDLERGLDDWDALGKSLPGKSLSSEEIESYMQNMVYDAQNLEVILTFTDSLLMAYAPGPKVLPNKVYYPLTPTLAM
jgi:tetrahydromethanopterin S-methyltransferase subunit B